MKPAKTLYCIADEASFRLLRGSGDDLEELCSVQASDLPGVEHHSSNAGRNHSGSGTSFGHSTGSDAEIERPRLAKQVVSALQAEWDKQLADSIFLAAGPKMLGALRDAIPKALAAHVAVELPKDLSKVPPHTLASHFGDK